MSTLAYASLTTKREEAQPTTSSSTSPPGVGAYVDVLAALVPAEVLTLHGLVVSYTTSVENGATKITSPDVLKEAALGLLVLSVVLYIVPRMVARRFDSLDSIRSALPPAAFVGWMMLQRATAFDAWFPQLPAPTRAVIALFLAVVLGAVAALLSITADKKQPQSPAIR